MVAYTQPVTFDCLAAGQPGQLPLTVGYYSKQMDTPTVTATTVRGTMCFGRSDGLGQRPRKPQQMHARDFSGILGARSELTQPATDERLERDYIYNHISGRCVGEAVLSLVLAFALRA